MCSYCDSGFRFETTVLGTGQVKAVLHPISAEWENGYSAPTDGSITLAVQDPALEDIYAGSSGLYISQVMKDGSRRCRFPGYIPKDNGVGGGTGRVALKSIDNFLNHRLIAGPNDPYQLFIDLLITAFPEQVLNFRIYKPATTTTNTLVASSGPTTGGTSALAAFLVRLAQGNIEGGPVVGLGELTARFQAPYTPVNLVANQIFANWWDFKNIGQALRELVEAENGVKYRLDSEYENGYWSTVMTFSDEIGTVRDYTIMSDREAKEYGLEIDAENKATRVYGVGSGEEGDTQFSIAYDVEVVDGPDPDHKATNLPEYQATVAWKDQTVPAVIDSLTRGYVADHRDPATVPSATLYGLPIYDPDDPAFDPQQGFPGPELLEPGDEFGVDIGYGFITVKDIQVKALAVAWALDQDDPPKRTIAMQPVVRANQSVRTQTPARPVAPDEPVATVTPQAKSIPWPTPGLVSRSQSTDLTEISGMQYSKANPGGYAWVVEDETETPDQVSLINTDNGLRAGYFNVTGMSPSPAGDPEAIRLARSTGKLVIADTGDNDLDRPNTGANQPSLLVVTEPKGGGNKGTLPTTRYPIRYPSSEKINVETLLIHPTTEEVFLVSKEATQARVFSYGALSSMSTSQNTGTLVATLGISMVSDGTHTFNGEFALFRTAKVAATQVYDVNPWGKVGTIATPAMVKSEAISVESSCAFLTTTEGSNAPIYRVLIPKAYGATCNTVTGPVGSGTGGAPNSKKVPGQVIDLNGWKLQLPISDGDGIKEVSWGGSPNLATFEQKPYFYTDNGVDVVFQSPVHGATTPHSENPRSEMRQMYGNGDPAAWNNKTSTWTMEARMAFTVMPTSSDPTRGVVGLQLHDSVDDVTVLRLEKNGDLYITQGDDTHAHLVTGSYALGTFMDVKLEARKGGGVRWYIDGVFEFLAVSGTVTNSYFKWGAYIQSASSGISGVGQTKFQSLRVWRS